MKRRAPVAMILMVLVAGLLGTTLASAQDGPTQVGEEVTFIDPDGIIRGTVAIKEVADPFDGNEPSYPPEPGTRYVMLVTTFQAAIDQPFDAQPSQVMLQGTDGSLWTSTYVPRPADSTIPDLQSQQMAPDNRISGVITYSLPEDLVIERVVYQPAYDRLLSLLELAPGSAPAPGEAITYTNVAGASANVSSQVMDPFTDFDPGNPPAEGMRFVMLQPVFENVGSLPYWADPYRSRAARRPGLHLWALLGLSAPGLLGAAARVTDDEPGRPGLGPRRIRHPR